MSTIKRITGDYTISPTGNLIIDGNLLVTGTTTTVDTTETTISDKIITLNSGEVGSGVTGIYSGFEIDRGSLDNVGLRWNETIDKWELSTDGLSYSEILTSGVGDGYLQNVVEDTTPQLGGNLDVNGKTITSVSDGDIVLDPNGTGLLKIDASVSLQDQASAPGSSAGYNKLYSSATQGGGASGLYFVNSSNSDELASRTRALLYGLIF